MGIELGTRNPGQRTENRSGRLGLEALTATAKRLGGDLVIDSDDGGMLLRWFLPATEEILDDLAPYGWLHASKKLTVSD